MIPLDDYARRVVLDFRIKHSTVPHNRLGGGDVALEAMDVNL
jgi:hypothetical protein